MLYFSHASGTLKSPDGEDVPTLLSPLTLIVGPAGSGKSAVAERLELAATKGVGGTVSAPVLVPALSRPKEDGSQELSATATLCDSATGKTVGTASYKAVKNVTPRSKKISYPNPADEDCLNTYDADVCLVVDEADRLFSGRADTIRRHLSRVLSLSIIGSIRTELSPKITPTWDAIEASLTDAADATNDDIVAACAKVKKDRKASADALDEKVTLGRAALGDEVVYTDGECETLAAALREAREEVKQRRITYTGLAAKPKQPRAGDEQRREREERRAKINAGRVKLAETEVALTTAKAAYAAAEEKSQELAQQEARAKAVLQAAVERAGKLPLGLTPDIVEAIRKTRDFQAGVSKCRCCGAASSSWDDASVQRLLGAVSTLTDAVVTAKAASVAATSARGAQDRVCSDAKTTKMATETLIERVKAAIGQLETQLSAWEAGWDWSTGEEEGGSAEEEIAASAEAVRQAEEAEARASAAYSDADKRKASREARELRQAALTDLEAKAKRAREAVAAADAVEKIVLKLAKEQAGDVIAPWCALVQAHLDETEVGTYGVELGLEGTSAIARGLMVNGYLHSRLSDGQLSAVTAAEGAALAELAAKSGKPTATVIVVKDRDRPESLMLSIMKKLARADRGGPIAQVILTTTNENEDFLAAAAELGYSVQRKQAPVLR